MDILYLGVVILFFILTFGLIWACDVVQEHKPGEHS